MNILNAFLFSLIAGLSTCLGTLFVFVPIKNKNKFICFSLALSLSVMIGISILDLLPESVFLLYKNFKYFSFVLLTILFILSFILIKYISKLLNKYNDSLYQIGILSMITLMLHNLPEGILTFLSSLYNAKLGLKMTIAIAIHNIPEGIAISVPIYFASGSYKKAFSKTLLSAMSEPLGALFAYLFLAKYMSDKLISVVLIVVSGLMITLAIEKMFPKAKEYNENKMLSLGIIIGFAIILIGFLIQ